MQSALSEVELSAVTSEHVFGEKHAEALEDLRTKQLNLAQAWARSEADDEVVDSSRNTADGESAQRRGSAEAAATTTTGTTAKDTAGTTAGESAPVRDRVSHRTLDEETEKDILLARRRRDANDRYFDRVNQGVLDVVAKLEEVSQAMRTVERESKDIWSDSESVTTAPPSTNAGS
jgi:septum formation topological specificity factor MinE